MIIFLFSWLLSSVFYSLFFMFVVEGRGRQPAARRNCGIPAAHYALKPRAAHLHLCAALHSHRRGPTGRRRSYFLLPAIRLQIIRRSASSAASVRTALSSHSFKLCFRISVSCRNILNLTLIISSIACSSYHISR